MEASKGSGRRAERAGPLQVVGWARRRRLLIAIAALVLTVTLIATPRRLAAWPLSTRASALHSLSAAQTASALRHCLRGVVTAAKGGHFGDSFMQWASAWALTRIYNLTLATPADLQRTLHLAFSDIPTGPTLAALIKVCPSGKGLSEKDALQNTLKTGNVSEAAAAFAAAAVSDATDVAAAPGPLVLPIYAPFITEYAEELRLKVRWRPELRDGAQATLRQVANTMSDWFGVAPQEVVVVGVHAPRSGFSEEMEVEVVAAADYYARALLRLARFLEEVADAEASRSVALGPLAAVVVSDDMDWARSVLLPSLDKMAGTFALKMASFASGGGTKRSALRDLALLSACNHTVISYGTYGMTAALLAGGLVVAYDLNSTYPSSQFAEILPGWMIMR